MSLALILIASIGDEVRFELGIEELPKLLYLSDLSFGTHSVELPLLNDTV